MARRKKHNKGGLISLILIIVILVYNTYYEEINNFIYSYAFKESYTLDKIPTYEGKDYIIIDNNEPSIDFEKFKDQEFESYSELDFLGRCGTAFANVSTTTMPVEERDSIGGIKPSGWHTVKYDIVDGKYLYNRCHLIGYQLTGENANEKNLITCTRQMNNEGMLYFENLVAEYIKETNNHVLYRVTPIYESSNLLASGIHLEAISVEDNGKGIKFNVYVFNVQDGIEINYKTGESSLK